MCFTPPNYSFFQVVNMPALVSAGVLVLNWAQSASVEDVNKNKELIQFMKSEIAKVRHIQYVLSKLLCTN